MTCLQLHICDLYFSDGCEPSGRDKTPGGPEEFRWTKSRHICIRIFAQSTHVNMYARRRDEIVDQLLFFFNIFFLPKKKSTRCKRKTKNSKLHRPSLKGTKLI